MANVAAYAGLRQGELFALTTGQVAAAARVITVDRKLIEVAGQLYVEAPKLPQVPQHHLPRPHPARVRWRTGSPPGPSRPAPSSRPGSTRSG